MTRILLTRGAKERMSDNAGRLLAAWDAAAGPGPSLALNNIPFAVEIACELERQLTAALTPEEDGA